MITCLHCEADLAYSDIDKPCPECSYVNASVTIDNKDLDDWTSVREDPVTDNMLNFLDTNCEQRRIEAEKNHARHGFYPYPYLEMKRLIYEIRALREHERQTNKQ